MSPLFGMSERIRALRWFLPALAVVVIAGVIVRSQIDSAPAATGKPANVLVILTDDQRADGWQHVMRSTMKWFGDRGRWFPNAFATTPLCCPSRASIFTGQYAHNHGIHNALGDGPFPHDRTIQAQLSQVGYHTAIVGKYLNGWPAAEDPPYFERWAITPKATFDTDARWGIDGRVEVTDRYSTTLIRDYASSLLDEWETDDATPWFLHLSVMAPHPPATPEPIYADTGTGPFQRTPGMDEADRTDKPPYIQAQPLRKSRYIQEHRIPQLRSLKSVDDLVEAVFQQLGALDERGNTLVVFASDNGYLWGEHGDLAKSDPYLESVHVPLFLYWPRRVDVGVVDERLVGLLDLAPTILDAAGIEPTGMDGNSLLRNDWDRDELLLEYWQGGGHSTPTWAGIQMLDSQYVEYYDEADAVTFREFYDLANDPAQLENLLGDDDPGNDPDVGTLGDRLRELRSCAVASCP